MLRTVSDMDRETKEMALYLIGKLFDIRPLTVPRKQKKAGVPSALSSARPSDGGSLRRCRNKSPRYHIKGGYQKTHLSFDNPFRVLGGFLLRMSSTAAVVPPPRTTIASGQPKST